MDGSNFSEDVVHDSLRKSMATLIAYAGFDGELFG